MIEENLLTEKQNVILKKYFKDTQKIKRNLKILLSGEPILPVIQSLISLLGASLSQVKEGEGRDIFLELNFKSIGYEIKKLERNEE